METWTVMCPLTGRGGIAKMKSCAKTRYLAKFTHFSMIFDVRKLNDAKKFLLCLLAIPCCANMWISSLIQEVVGNIF